MRAKIPSLRRQLIFWLLLPLVVIWVIGSMVAYNIAIQYSDLANDRSLFDSTLTLAGQIKYLDGRTFVSQADTALQMITVDPYDKVYFKVSDLSNHLIAGKPELPNPPEENIFPDKPYYQDGKIDGKHVRIASIVHHVSNGTGEESILVQVAETLTKRKMLASEIIAGLVLPQLLLITLAMFIVWYGIKRGLSSLDRLQEEVENRSYQDLSSLREDNVPKEVAVLIHAINDLLKRIEYSITAQTRFIADAAHQLRTPLAGIKTQTDFALRQSDQALIQHSLQQLHISADKSIHLVNQLLTLARAEPGSVLPQAKVDLVNISLDVCREWVPQALKKEIDLGFESTESEALIVGNDFLLREMINNLVDNAIRYTQHGGKVTVRVARQDGNIILSVEDNGPGIPDDERELIFERFHRGKEARPDGCGLGLAIVREIAHRHNAEAYLLNQATGSFFGVRFHIST